MDGTRDPAFLGITDAVFRPLTAAGKFLYLCRIVGAEWEKLRTATNTVNPKGRGGLKDLHRQGIAAGRCT